MLYRLAEAILAIPATSGAPERVFSVLTRIMTDHRTSIDKKLLCAIVVSAFRSLNRQNRKKIKIPPFGILADEIDIQDWEDDAESDYDDDDQIDEVEDSDDDDDYDEEEYFAALRASATQRKHGSSPNEEDHSDPKHARIAAVNEESEA